MYLHVAAHTWTQQAKLVASDGVAGDSFGNSVTVLNNVITVGAPQHTTALGTQAGAVYVYSLQNGQWLQQRASLLAVDGSPYTAKVYLGTSLAISGTNLMVGAPGKGGNAGNGMGAVYTYSTAPPENPNLYKPACPYCYAGGEYFGDPIGIRRGEKRDEVTDLTLQTAAGDLLSFTRTYQPEYTVCLPIHGIGLDAQPSRFYHVYFRNTQSGGRSTTQCRGCLSEPVWNRSLCGCSRLKFGP